MSDRPSMVAAMLRRVSERLKPRWIDGPGASVLAYLSKEDVAYQAGYLAGFADAMEADRAAGEDGR